MARALGKKLSQLPFEKGIHQAFRRFLTRPPTAGEMRTLTNYYTDQRRRLESNEIRPQEILQQESDSLAAAAMTMVCRVIMNLDETITKQ